MQTRDRPLRATSRRSLPAANGEAAFQPLHYSCPPSMPDPWSWKTARTRFESLADVCLSPSACAPAADFFFRHHAPTSRRQVAGVGRITVGYNAQVDVCRLFTLRGDF